MKLKNHIKWNFPCEFENVWKWHWQGKVQTHYLSYKHFTLALISISHSPGEFFHTSPFRARGKTFCFVTIILYLLFWCSHSHTFSILRVLSILWKWKNFSTRLMWFYHKKNIFRCLWTYCWGNFNRKNVFTTKSSTGIASFINACKAITFAVLFKRFSRFSVLFKNPILNFYINNFCVDYNFLLMTFKPH